MNKEICILNGTKWILGDESTEPMNWEDANNWCKSIGQDLPPREVLLMAFLNPEIRSKFANDYYWSSSEFDSNFAWLQDFTNGYQKYYWSKLNTLSVQAVWAISAEASEHTEQEPVALKETMQDIWDVFNDVFIGTTIQKSLAQELIIKAHHAGVKAAQKREPLSDKEITKNTPKLIHIGERLAFHAGVRFSERHHIIGVNDDT
jgi:hypothetical protein